MSATGLSSPILIADPRLVSGDMTPGTFRSTYLCLGQLFTPARLWSDLVNRLTQTPDDTGAGAGVSRGSGDPFRRLPSARLDGTGDGGFNGRIVYFPRFFPRRGSGSGV